MSTERQEINELKRKIFDLKVENERLSLENNDLRARLVKVYRYAKTTAFEETHNRLTILAKVRNLTQNFN
jgi:regulator of replication initiation timing